MRSHTPLDVYMLQGEVPETVVLGETYDIRQFCKHGFYDWVMFRYDPIKYPDINSVLDRYLGPAIDVGLEMTANIMNAYGKIVHGST